MILMWAAGCCDDPGPGIRANGTTPVAWTWVPTFEDVANEIDGDMVVGQAVPEPLTAVMFGMGTIALLAQRRRYYEFQSCDPGR